MDDLSESTRRAEETALLHCSPILCAAIGQFPDANKGHGEHDEFVIITADAQGGMVDIHDRRPVVLAPDLAQEWFDPATPQEHSEQLVLQPAEVFEWFKVERALGTSRNQGVHLIERRNVQDKSDFF
ncbi:Gifsy-2 prophage protein [Pseudomonas chlororaphis]|nr:SOS response-associated peptidase family protein [Pseudomonas chlororaphis]AZD14982.1 Gifsy-2 prophage protein [Pseudomonas chlororaphis]WQE20531.1 SOS response-associated peptidase family protein [Pseudomonas chlororaphis]